MRQEPGDAGYAVIVQYVENRRVKSIASYNMEFAPEKEAKR